MWRVLGNASLDDPAAQSRQSQRRPVGAVTKERPPAAPVAAVPRRSPSTPDEPADVCGKYRVTSIMRRGATGFLYSAVIVARSGQGDSEDACALGPVGTEVVLKIEECAAVKRQMQNEWQVGRYYPSFMLTASSASMLRAPFCVRVTTCSDCGHDVEDIRRSSHGRVNAQLVNVRERAQRGKTRTRCTSFPAHLSQTHAPVSACPRPSGHPSAWCFHQ